MNKFLRNVMASLLFGVFASACLSDVVSAPVTMKEKPTSQKETLLKSKDIPEKAEPEVVKKTSDYLLPVPEEMRAAIKDHIDPETGEKYQELQGTFPVRSIKHIRVTSVRRLFIVNGILVQERVGGETNPTMDYGDVIKPKELKWEDLVGFNVDIHCKIREIIDKKHNASLYCDLVSKASENKWYSIRFH